MKKRLLLAVVMVSVMTMLTGCCISHEWNEATCTEAIACAKCGETEGEALGHAWEDATCTDAKACFVCGETEGEALGHELTEANYQQASVCAVCGEICGEPLQPDFEKYGLVCNVELDKVYDTVVMCYDNEDATTTAKTVFSNYQVFEYDDMHPVKEGYEWRTVDVAIVFYDENAMEYGWSMGECFENYFDVVGNDESMGWDDETGDMYFTVNYNGVEYAECLQYETTIDKLYFDDDTSSIRAWTMHYLVPKGYDGCVYGIRNEQIEWGDNQHIFDIDNTDTLFFRLANIEDVKQYVANDVSDINLTYDVAVKVVNNFYMNMLNYFADDAIIGFFDENGDMSINQTESMRFLAWAVDNYNPERSETLSEDGTIRAAADYLAGKLNVPDELYLP